VYLLHLGLLFVAFYIVKCIVGSLALYEPAYGDVRRLDIMNKKFLFRKQQRCSIIII